MVNAVQISSMKGLAATAPPDDAAAISSMKGLVATAPPDDAAAIAAMKALAALGPPEDAVSLSSQKALVSLGPPEDAVSISVMHAYAITQIAPVAAYDWPQALLVPRKVKFSIVPFNTTGGQGFTNAEQVIGNTPGRCRMVLQQIRVITDEQILAWEGLQTGLRGRSATITVPLYRWRRGQTPWPTINGILITSSPGYSSPVIGVVPLADMAIGSMTADLQAAQAGTLKPGHVWSVNGRCYQISDITATDLSGPYPIYSVRFAPPVREFVEAGTALNFDNPKLICRLSDDDAMGASVCWDLWKSDHPSLTFWEDLSR